MPEKKTMVFTIGRMNPPTNGHLELIKIVMQTNYELPASDLGRGKVYLILSNKQDMDNPLSCPRKRVYLEQKGMIAKIKRTNPEFSAIQVEIICMDEKTTENCEKWYKFNPDPLIKIKPNPILNQICYIIEKEKNITNAQLVLGGKRQKEFGWLGSFFEKNNIKLNEDEEKTEEINKKLNRIEKLAPELVEEYMQTDKEIPIEHMSATLMRGLVRNNKKEKFIGLVQKSGVSLEEAEELYEEIKYNLTSPVEKESSAAMKKTASSSRKAATSKSKGGRKRKGKTIKRNKNKRRLTKRRY